MITFNASVSRATDRDDQIQFCPEGKRYFDVERAEFAIRELLLAFGEDPERDGLIDTPRRVTKMYRELLSGLDTDPAEHLSKTFDETHDEIVLLRNIRFSSICEHHLLPFVGVAHVAYLPGQRVVGLSKLARTVDVFARRPQVQERMTNQVADALMAHLDAKGALVVIESEHYCIKMRGVCKHDATMITTASRGVFRLDKALRAEAMALIHRGAEA